MSKNFAQNENNFAKHIKNFALAEKNFAYQESKIRAAKTLFRLENKIVPNKKSILLKIKSCFSPRK